MTTDLILRSPGGPARLADVVRLYQVVLGRPADPVGLRSNLEQLHDGVPLSVLAGAMLASDEFARQPGPAAAVLRRNALGNADAPCPADATPAGLAVALVRSLPVMVRHPVLPALAPDGLVVRGWEDYRVWLAGHPCPGPLPQGVPPVSFVVPVDGRAADGALDTICSILALGWPGLDVVVPAIHPGLDLRHLAQSDGRIRLLRPWFGPGPAGLLARGLARARGAFAAVVMPGERLDPRAGGRVAAALAGADIVLTDEDGVDAAGLRHDPRFGDAWDPDRALAAGRPGLVLARTPLLRAAGGAGWDGLLALSRLVPAGRIVQVPALLLSRPAPLGLPSDRADRARRHLLAVNEPGEAVADGDGVRVVYALPAVPPRLSVVVATRNRAELLGPCIDGVLHRTDYPDLEVVLVDNGSDEPDALALLERLALDARVRVLRQPGPFNWSVLNNAGVAASAGEVVLLLNNDTVVIEPGWLREMASQALRPGVGAVGAKLLYPDDTVQHAGVVLGRDGHAIHMWCGMPGDVPGHGRSLVTVREVSAVTGACLAMRRAVFDAVGGCEAALAVTWNDTDLCLRVRAQGLRVIWTPHARLLHLEQATRGSDATPENDARFRREQAWMRARWGEALVRDPFLNPNLLPSGTALRLAVRLP